MLPHESRSTRWSTASIDAKATKISDHVYKPYNVNRNHAFIFHGRATLKALYCHRSWNDWQLKHHIDHHMGNELGGYEAIEGGEAIGLVQLCEKAMRFPAVDWKGADLDNWLAPNLSDEDWHASVDDAAGSVKRPWSEESQADQADCVYRLASVVCDR